MSKIKLFILSSIFGILVFFGCQKKFDLSELPAPTSLSKVGDTTYIQKGAWSGFNNPRTIIYGQDQLLYVADTYNNQIVMLNTAGQVLSKSKFILRPISIAQDNRLDLLVGAEMIEPTTHDTIGMVLRIKLVSHGHNLDLASTTMDTIWKEAARPKRRFVGIGILLDNEYLIVRDGPDNSSLVDPDARVLRFKYTKIDSTHYVDRFITPLSDLQIGQGASVTSLNHPTGIAVLPNSSHFIVTQRSDGVQYSALWMVYVKSESGEAWLPFFDPSVVSGIEFITPNRFRDASGVCVDKKTRDVYIVDAALDSVVKFNSRGRLKSESFGLKTPGIELKHPGGIASAEKTLYVCDTQNNRIVLYRLSTDN